MIIDRPKLLDGLYLVSLRAAKHRLSLTLPEAKAILDACNGLHLKTDLLGHHLRLDVQGAIRLASLDTKWGIDGASLVARLREMPPSLSSAVEIWIADFWSSEQLNDAAFERAHYLLMVDLTPKDV